MPSALSYHSLLFVGAVMVFMTHIKETESFTLGRSQMASGVGIVEDSHETSTAIDGRLEEDTQIKTIEGDLDYNGGRLVQQQPFIYNPATDKSRVPKSAAIYVYDDAVKDDNFPVQSPGLDQLNLRHPVEAVVVIQVVKQLPSSNKIVVDQKDNEIHAEQHSLEHINQDVIQSQNVHYLPTGEISMPIDQQWHFVKEFITSDSHFGELDEFSKEHFLQKMLRALMASQSQEWGQ